MKRRNLAALRHCLNYISPKRMDVDMVAAAERKKKMMLMIKLNWKCTVREAMSSLLHAGGV